MLRVTPLSSTPVSTHVVSGHDQGRSYPHAQWLLRASDCTPLLQLSHKEDTVLGFRVHRMLKAESPELPRSQFTHYYEAL